jgi:hypothetical protein
VEVLDANPIDGADGATAGMTPITDVLTAVGDNRPWFVSSPICHELFSPQQYKLAFVLMPHA